MWTLKAVISLCINLLSREEKGHPGGVFKSAEGVVPYRDAITELKRVREWLYPELRTGDVQLVVRCRNCTHYKRLKKKNSIKPVYKYICELDGAERTEDFFCKNGDKEENCDG